MYLDIAWEDHTTVNIQRNRCPGFDSGSSVRGTLSIVFMMFTLLFCSIASYSCNCWVDDIERFLYSTRGLSNKARQVTSRCKVPFSFIFSLCRSYIILLQTCNFVFASYRTTKTRVDDSGFGSLS